MSSARKRSAIRKANREADNLRQRLMLREHICDVTKQFSNALAKKCENLQAQLDQLSDLARASLDARNAEAKASMALDNAIANFHRHDAEARAFEKAMIAASEADRKLREAIGN